MRSVNRRENEAIVRIAETGTSRGLGIFAKENIPLGHRVIFERPVLSCTAANHINASLVFEWTRIGIQGQNQLKSYFWKLRLIPSSDDSGSYTVWRLKSFMREYAYLQFSDPKRGNIYKWCSYLNHACRDCANATYVVDTETGAISVTTARPLSAGEEVIVSYNRGKGNLNCVGCKPISAPRSAWYFLRYRVLRWAARMAWLKGEEDHVLFPGDDPTALPTQKSKSHMPKQQAEPGRLSSIMPEFQRKPEHRQQGGRVFTRLRGACLNMLTHFHNGGLHTGQDTKDIELESENDALDQGNKAQ